MSETLALDYRPKTLEKIIGHESSVTRLKGMLASKKIPNALLFIGPTSAGKTTLARAVARAINDDTPIEKQMRVGDYTELDGGSSRSIEDIRSLVQQSRFKPRGKKKIIVIDEFQSILSSGGGAAAEAFLKPLEEPSKDTLWVLCSMEPSKFQSGKGKAIAGRCVQYVLEPHTDADLMKQAKRMIKGEDIKYLDDEALKEIVRCANGTMRGLASLMQGAIDYYQGLDKKPKILKADSIASILSTTETKDDQLAVKVIFGILAGQYKVVHRALLDVAEPFPFINKMLYLSSFLLNEAVLGNERHSKVWYSNSNRELKDMIKKHKLEVKLGALAALNEHMVELKSRSQAFAVSELELISAASYRLIKVIHPK